jgi:GPH family glycoside/pentoside/hexuronide:cation symporter
MGIGVGIISIVPILITFFGTRERTEFAEQDPTPFFASLKAAFKNRPFVFSMVMFLLVWVCIDLLLAMILLFIQYGLGRGDQSDLIMGPIFVMALIALPLWLAVANRLDKRRAFMVGMAFWAVMQVVLITLTPESSMVMILVVSVIAGIGVSAAHVLPWAIVPDAVEYDEWLTGKRHEGTFFSILTLAQKVASSLAVPGALLMLELFGWVSGEAVQTPRAVMALRVLVGPVPAVLLAGAIVLAIFYPLGRAEFERIVAELEERRARDASAGNPPKE